MADEATEAQIKHALNDIDPNQPMEDIWDDSFVLKLISKIKRLQQEKAALEDVLLRYTQWESNLLVSDAVWQDGAPYPSFNDDLWDQFMEVQAYRVQVLDSLVSDLGD